MRRKIVSIFLSLSVMSACVGWMGSSFGAEHPREPGIMLREGTWDGGVGSYSVPEVLSHVKPAEWPIDGWARLTIRTDHIDIEPVLLPKRQTPPFLKKIAAQLEGMQTESVSPQSVAQVPVGNGAGSVETLAQYAMRAGWRNQMTDCAHFAQALVLKQWQDYSADYDADRDRLMSPTQQEK